MSSASLKIFLQQSGIINEVFAEQVAAHFRPVSYLKNEYFLKEGQATNEYMFIEQGIR